MVPPLNTPITRPSSKTNLLFCCQVAWRQPQYRQAVREKKLDFAQISLAFIVTHTPHNFQVSPQTDVLPHISCLKFRMHSYYH